MSFIGNIGLILAGFVVIITMFLILLSAIEKRLHIKIVQTRYTPNQIYLVKLSQINIKKPKEAMKVLDSLTKAFFREAFHIKGSPDYSELEEMFAKRNNKKALEFCQEMNKFLYSNLEATKKDVQMLIRLYAEIIASNRILTKDEQKELDKLSLLKNPKKPSALKKINFLKRKR